VRRRVSLILLVVSGCVTTGRGTRLDQLEADAGDCPSFERFAAEARTQSDALVETAAADDLMRASGRLSKALRTCARHTLSGLLDLREREGVTAAQHELDALARTLGATELRELMLATLAADVATLEPLVAEAVAHAHRAPAAPKTMGPAPVDEPTTCRDLEPCAAVSCLAEQRDERPRLTTSARACVDGLRAQTPDEQARGLARLVPLVDAVPAVLTEVQVSLETLRRQRWPEVEAALQAQKPALAARLAAPFAVLPQAKADVAAVLKAAVVAHRALAAQRSPQAAQVHRRLAAVFSGEAPGALTAPAGKWERPTWNCDWALPELPPAFPGAQLRLLGRCSGTKSTAPADRAGEALTTFDLERSMRRERVEGTLVVSCAGRTTSSRFAMDDVLADSALGHDDALAAQVQHLVEKARATCRTYAETSARSECTVLDRSSPEALEERFTALFFETGSWAPCFAKWFEERYGVPPGHG
jgi:hypothetical protein